MSKAKPVAGEAERLGMGVSYCATCDGMLYRGRDVVVWGLAEEAASEANFLAGIGCRVTFVAARRPAELEEAIPFEAGAIREVLGEGVVSAVRLADGRELPLHRGVYPAGRRSPRHPAARSGAGRRVCAHRAGHEHQCARRVCCGGPGRQTPAGGQGRGRRPGGGAERSEYLDRADREGK